MRENITINGTEYKALEITYNTICDLDEIGTPIHEFGAKSDKVLRGYIALVMGVSLKAAGEEIQRHVINGGSLVDLATCLTEAITESDFLNAPTPKAEKATPKSRSNKQ